MRKNSPYLSGFPTHLQGKQKQSQIDQFCCDRDKLVERLISDVGQVFGDIIKPEHLAEMVSGRCYTAATTFWAWVTQVVDFNSSCTSAVSTMQSWRAEADQEVLSSNTAAYCKARMRLKESDISQLEGVIDGYIERRLDESDRWHGFMLKAIDATSVKLLDTEANQEEYPQPSGQTKGCGFPLMGITGVLNLSKGTVAAYKFHKQTQHDVKAAHNLIGEFVKGDICIADRAYCSYGFIAQLLSRGAHSVMRLNGQRDKKFDWRSGKKIGKNQRQVTWIKPTVPSEAMDADEWEALPSKITLRYIKVIGADQDSNDEPIILVTTLLDPDLYDAEEISYIYQERWKIEVKFRDIKTTLGYSLCRTKTPEMARKTMQVVFTAYNLIKALQIESIQDHPLVLDQISFKQTIEVVTAQKSRFRGREKFEKKKAEIRDELCDLIAKKVLLERPGRTEPRVTKTKPRYNYMTYPRSEFHAKRNRSVVIS